MSTTRIRQLDWETIGHALRRVVNVVGILALVAVVVPFVIYGAPGVVGADESFVVLSSSMEPAMSPGDVVVVNEVEADAIARGDVITYVNRGSSAPTTHRVIDVQQLESGTAFRTMGDANEDPDSRLVHSQQLVGQVATVQGHLFVIPYIGHIIQYGKSPLGFLSLVALPVGLLVVTELVVLVRNARANQRREPNAQPQDDERPAVAGAENDGQAAFNPIPLESTDGEPGGEPSDNGTAGGSRPGDDTGTGSGASDGSGADGSNTVSISGTDVRATTVVLAVFGTYSAWVAYTTPNVLSITLGVAGVVLLVLCVGLLLATRGGGDDTDGSSASPSTPATDGGVQSQSDAASFPIPLIEDDYPDGEDVNETTNATDAPDVLGAPDEAGHTSDEAGHTSDEAGHTSDERGGASDE